jgi:pimeloyl-ACP methyl ester carboxylesterase
MSCTSTTSCNTARDAPTLPRRDTILFLHGSLSNGDGWHRTVAALRPLYRCLTPDLIGYGASMPWPKGVHFTLDAERLVLEPLLSCCADTFHLVGYSYGGVVALDMALAHPDRVRTLTLIEPVLFNVLREAGKEFAFQHFARMRNDYVAALSQGPVDAALRPFVDFWTGHGSWDKLPLKIRADMLRTAGKVALDWQASFAFFPSRQGLSALAPRTLLLRGDESPPSMLELVDTLHALMPESTHQVVPGANHLLPITCAAEVTEAILQHLHAEGERRLR